MLHYLIKSIHLNKGIDNIESFDEDQGCLIVRR